MYSKQIRAAYDRTENTTVFTTTGNNPENPDYACPEYLAMLPDVKVVRDVYGGTKALRANGQEYLPQHPMETEDAYRERLKVAVCQNMLKRAVGGLVGMIFRRDPILEDVPPEIVADYENIDQQGSSLPVFAKRVAEAALRDGLTWLHEEYPTLPTVQRNGREDRPRSRADMAALGLRPYYVHVLFEDAINWQYEYTNGVPELTLFVYRESTSVAKGTYGQEAETRYRVLRPGTWEVWAERKVDDATEWALVEAGATSLGYIPVDPVFGPDRTGPFSAHPPFLDVAYENIEHYRVRSDYQHALSFCSQPIPYVTGHDPEGKLGWGSNQMLVVPNEEAEVGVLESTGVALGASVTELQRIESAIAMLSLSMLVARTNAGPETATGEIIDKAEGDSELSTFAKSLEAVFNSAHRTLAEYRGIKNPGRIRINKDFSALVIDPQLARLLLDMVNSGKLTNETLWATLQWWEVLPEDFDAVAEAAALEEQSGKELKRLAEAMRETPPAAAPVPDEDEDE